MRTAIPPEDTLRLADVASGSEAAIRDAAGTGRPTLLVEDGRGVAVLMSPELFDELAEAAARLDLIEALDAGESDLANGRVVAHSTVAAQLRSWSQGTG